MLPRDPNPSDFNGHGFHKNTGIYGAELYTSNPSLKTNDPHGLSGDYLHLEEQIQENTHELSQNSNKASNSTQNFKRLHSPVERLLREQLSSYKEKNSEAKKSPIKLKEKNNAKNAGINSKYEVEPETVILNKADTLSTQEKIFLKDLLSFSKAIKNRAMLGAKLVSLINRPFMKEAINLGVPERNLKFLRKTFHKTKENKAKILINKIAHSLDMFINSPEYKFTKETFVLERKKGLSMPKILARPVKSKQIDPEKTFLENCYQEKYPG